MSARLVFDTNVLSYVMRDDPRGDIVTTLRADRDATISFQTYEELWRGAYKAGWSIGNLERLRTYLASFTIQHSNDELALRCAKLRADQERRGLPLSTADA